MRFSDPKGVAALEFAVTLPLLAVLVFGLIDFGCLLYDKQVITNAGREAARAGITRKKDIKDTEVDNEQIKKEIEQIALDYCCKPGISPPESRLINLGGSTHEVTIKTEPENLEELLTQKDLTVQVSYTYDFLFASLFKCFKIIESDQIELQSQTTMRLE